MSDQSALLVALEEFEACLEVPLIPGEFPNWTAAMKRACSQAVTALEEHIPVWHLPVLDQISREDPELATRVQKLRDEDAALLSQAAQVEAEANMIAGDATELESQDPTIQQDVEGFIARGLAWIIQVRKQEAALTAWYQEAFNRDTGVAD
ncbi:MAG TPA: hypothetical protein VMM76_02090 [Pirellulaceae bacterium]|nr:hypothetical protein [Pirellulaceae bacterium]